VHGPEEHPCNFLFVARAARQTGTAPLAHSQPGSAAPPREDPVIRRCTLEGWDGQGLTLGTGPLKVGELSRS